MTVLYTGCSYTAGAGWRDEKQSEHLWVNILHDLCWPDQDKINAGKTGGSNQLIFERTVQHMSGHPDINTVVVQWTSDPRHYLEPGFELYETRLPITPGIIDSKVGFEFNLNDINYSKKFIQDWLNKYIVLHHPQHMIVKLIGYVNILIKLAERLQVKIYFVNGLCPWDNGFFDKKTNVQPCEYTAFTQELLNVHNRDDNEIKQLYDLMHTQYKNKGTIQQTYWIDLYYCLNENKIDVNYDGTHPGKQSNLNYANYLYSKLNKL